TYPDTPSSSLFPYTTLFRSPRFGFAKPPPFGKGCFGAHSKGSLVKGSWHGEAVTEGFYSRYFFKVQTNVETCHPRNPPGLASPRSEEHTSELQSRFDLVCRL